MSTAKESCSSCGSSHIQNKKYKLCGECVFKKSHGGKSRAEVYQEKMKAKPKPNVKIKTYLPSNYLLIGGDEIGLANRLAQDIAEQREKEEQHIIHEGNLEGFLKTSKFKKQKPVKKISKKQAEINYQYKLTCIDMDYTEEPVCSGCLRYQGGDIKLSHSHVISREDCKRIGREELIYDRENLRYHCMNFGENEGCHGKWENPSKRHQLVDYERNLAYIKSISTELYRKYLKHST